MGDELSVMIREGRKTDVNLLEELDSMVICHLNYLALIDKVTHLMRLKYNQEVEDIYQKKRVEIKGKLTHIDTIDTERLSLIKTKYKIKPRAKKFNWSHLFDAKFSRPEFIYENKPFVCPLRDNSELHIPYKKTDFTTGDFGFVDEEYLNIFEKYIGAINFLRERYLFLTSSLSEVLELKKFIYPKANPLKLKPNHFDVYLQSIHSNYESEFKNQSYIFKEYYLQVQVLFNQFIINFKNSYLKQSDLIYNRLEKDVTYSGLKTVSIKLYIYYTSQESEVDDIDMVVRVSLRRYIGKYGPNTIYKSVKSKQTKVNETYRIQTYNYDHVIYHEIRPVPQPYFDIVRELVEATNLINIHIKILMTNMTTITAMFDIDKPIPAMSELI